MHLIKIRLFFFLKIYLWFLKTEHQNLKIYDEFCEEQTLKKKF